MNSRFDWAKGQRAWGVFRWLLFGAALTLALYLPYRYAVRPPALPSLYAFLLPLTAILAVMGMALALKPTLSFRIPIGARAGIAAVAVLWFAAGIVCIPALGARIVSAPAIGLLATFQMVMQHLFLATVVAVFAVKPDQTCVWIGLSPGGAPDEAARTAVVESQANV